MTEIYKEYLYSWNEMRRSYWTGVGLGGLIGIMIGLFLPLLRWCAAGG